MITSPDPPSSFGHTDLPLGERLQGQYGEGINIPPIGPHFGESSSRAQAMQLWSLKQKNLQHFTRIDGRFQSFIHWWGKKTFKISGSS